MKMPVPVGHFQVVMAMAALALGLLEKDGSPASHQFYQRQIFARWVQRDFASWEAG